MNSPQSGPFHGKLFTSHLFLDGWMAMNGTKECASVHNHQLQYLTDSITKRNPRGITKRSTISVSLSEDNGKDDAQSLHYRSEDVPSKKYNVMYYATSIYQMASFDKLTAVWLLGFTALAQVTGVAASQTMEQKNKNPFTNTDGTKERGSVQNHLLQYLTDKECPFTTPDYELFNSAYLHVIPQIHNTTTNNNNNNNNNDHDEQQGGQVQQTFLAQSLRTGTMWSPSGTKLTVVVWSYASSA
eukprot:jgi/Psemu1/20467/gm1.20467_g